MHAPRLRLIAIADDSAAFAAAAAEHVAALPGYALAARPRPAAQALELVQTALPDVLLLGLGLRPALGLERVRRIAALRHAPAVVAMTLFATPEGEAAAQGAGAVALIGKESFVAGLAATLDALFPATLAL